MIKPQQNYQNIGIQFDPNTWIVKKIKANKKKNQLKESIQIEFADVEVLERLNKRKTLSEPIKQQKYYLPKQTIPKVLQIRLTEDEENSLLQLK